MNRAYKTASLAAAFSFLAFAASSVSVTGFSSVASAAKPKPPADDVGAPPALPRPAKIFPAGFKPPVPSRVEATATTPEILVLPQRELPLVTITVVVRAGTSLDPADRPGLASAVAAMLQDGGAGSRTAPELAEAFEALGDELAIECDPDGVHLSMTTLSKNLVPALSLIADVLAHPRFDAAEWSRFRTRRVAEILKQRDEPRTAADLVYRKLLFGAHPYGAPVLGTRASVEGMSDADLRAFHAKRYGPHTTSVILVGDVGADAAPKLVSTAFGAWKSEATPPPIPVAPNLAKATRIVLVDRPGAPQSEVRVGEVGLSRGSADYASGSVAAVILGGSFTSRLVQNLREKHGYTYGASSRFHFWNAPGPFVARSAIRTDVTGPALGEMLSELRGIGTISTEEAGKGCALVENDVTEAFSTGREAASAIADLAMHGLPVDTWEKFHSQLALLDATSLGAAARRLIHPDALTIVIVGDRKLVEPQLRKLPAVKSIEFRDIDGNVVK